MKTTLVSIAVALVLGALAGCDRTSTSSQSKAPPSTSTPPPAGAGSSSAATPATPNTPANIGTPTQAEKKESTNPQQGQVDPKQPAQQRDFQQKGDSAGPKPGG